MAGGEPKAQVVGEVLNLPIGAIEIGRRLRPIDRTWAEALGQIMAVEGQHAPIQVCRPPGKSHYLLVSGAHRLAGAIHVGWRNIRAIVVSHSTVERRRREVAENLWRQDLAPIDRATFIAELVSLAKVQLGLAPDSPGRAASAGARWARVQAKDATETISVAYGWAQIVADQIGLTDRTVRSDLALYRGLAAGVADDLRGHAVSRSAGQLAALCRLIPDQQREVATLILAGTARTVAQATAILRQQPAPDPAAKAWSAFVGGWSRMGMPMRRAALHHLVGMGLPTGVTITFDRGAEP